MSRRVKLHQNAPQMHRIRFELEGPTRAESNAVPS